MEDPKHQPQRASAILCRVASGGTGEWLVERATAAALVPMTMWFVASIIASGEQEHASVVEWLSSPLPWICMVLLLIVLFYHTALGLQVVIEDYVHSGARGPLLAAVRLGCLGFAMAGIAAMLRIGLNG